MGFYWKENQRILRDRFNKLSYFRDILIETGFSTDPIHMYLDTMRDNETYSVTGSLGDNVYITIDANTDRYMNNRAWVSTQSFKPFTWSNEMITELVTEDHLIQYLIDNFERKLARLHRNRGRV